MKRAPAFLLWLPLWTAVAAPDRYIVELATEPVAAHVARIAPRPAAGAALTSGAARAHRALLRSGQARARTGAEALGARVIGQVDTVANALLVEATAEQAARLEKLAGVVRVFRERRFHLTLDYALPVHRVPEVWAQVGADNAGAGVKIGVIDTGIDVSHPGLQDPGLSPPDGFPKVSEPSDAAFTSGKVIVARSYAALFSAADPDPSARDNVGHGTAVAMCAAGVPNAGPWGAITGVAPKAWLGSYKVFGTTGVNDSPGDAVILKAIDDAVADGMDVINLSLGSGIAPALAGDPLVEALERAAGVGVIVVVSAGNDGPEPNTISSPGTAPDAITVGASGNARIFSTSVLVTGGGSYVAISYVAIPGGGPAPFEPVTAPLVDVAALGNDGRACSALPPGSLDGSIALILRRPCSFEEKLLNAQAAGAVGAVVYSDEASPDPVSMFVGAATLPAEMVSWQDGTAIKALLPGPLEATLQFTSGPVAVDFHKLAGFSGRGPNVDRTIKPDMVAVGTTVYTATQTADPSGALYSPDGYTLLNGTSFSAPLVAGAAALLKAARPGLTAAQYRSLLVNSAAPASLSPGQPARAQEAGAGMLDTAAALLSHVAATPVSLSFGTDTAGTWISRRLTLTNVGSVPDTYVLEALPCDGAPAPALPEGPLQLDPGASTELEVWWPGDGLAPGHYEGVIAVRGAASGIASRIPYWYAVGPSSPQAITVLYMDRDARAGGAATFLFRVTDAAGLGVTDVQPEVSVVSGGGSVGRVRSRDPLYPAVFSASVTLGIRRGANVFRIQVGDLAGEVTIAGQ